MAFLREGAGALPGILGEHEQRYIHLAMHHDLTDIEHRDRVGGVHPDAERRIPLVGATLQAVGRAHYHVGGDQGARTEGACGIAPLMEPADGRQLPVGELQSLRRAVIHGDANDDNLLVDDSGDRVCGIIDFGDLMNTALIAELSVAAAYATLGKPDPVAAVLPLLRGYHAEYPLEEREVRLLGELLQIRLAVSLANCAHRRRQHPENEYLSVSSARAWDVLDLLADVDLGTLGDTFERARREVTAR